MLRNALLPTIAVVATQVGYLLGGLVAIELLFNYQGIGQRRSRPRSSRTSPCSRRASWSSGSRYLVATLLADILYALLNPRIRFGGAE